MLDHKFNQFSNQVRTKDLRELEKILPEWEAVGIQVEALGEKLTELAKVVALMKLVPVNLEASLKTKRANKEIGGCESIARFVKALVSDQCAERNAAGLAYGP